MPPRFRLGQDPSQFGHLIHPFDIAELEERVFAEATRQGTTSPPNLFWPGGLATGINHACEPLSGYKGGGQDGNNCIRLVAITGNFSTGVFNYGENNLLKLGSIKSSVMWIVIPQNVVGDALAQKITQGCIQSMSVLYLSNLSNNDQNSIPVIVRAIEFQTCYIIFVDLFSSPYLVVVGFSYLSLVMTRQDRDPTEDHQARGNRVTTIDFSSGGAKNSA
ncbi:MAG: hypothetical protein LBL32_00385 [Holosporales bacterium]|jgi:hypothetical protein|nr:hypothetical protein [Holosporales bacterium]